jgi:hypothetical protein
MIATIQRVKAVEKIESVKATNVTLSNGRTAIDFSSRIKEGELCVHIDSKKLLEGRGNRLDFPELVVPISVLEGPEEMKIGISQQPWGEQLQLGPYDNALVIEEGVDVTAELGLSKILTK